MRLRMLNLASFDWERSLDGALTSRAPPSPHGHVTARCTDPFAGSPS